MVPERQKWLDPVGCRQVPVSRKQKAQFPERPKGTTSQSESRLRTESESVTKLIVYALFVRELIKLVQVAFCVLKHPFLRLSTTMAISDVSMHQNEGIQPSISNESTVRWTVHGKCPSFIGSSLFIISGPSGGSVAATSSCQI